MSYDECDECRLYADCPHLPKFDSERCEFSEPSPLPEEDEE